MNWVAADLPARFRRGHSCRELYAEAQVAGCQETGMRVVIACGGCAGSAP